MSGNQIKVKFFSMTNVNNSLYTKFEVISPKRVLYDDVVVDLTKLNVYNKSMKDGMFVGAKQTKKDSLFVGKNLTKTWENGHTGFFSLFDTLIFDNKIREILGVDGDWDGEWSEEDILDGLSEKEIQLRINKYRNDPWIKYFPTMEKLWTKLAETEQFIQKCKDVGILQETFNYYIKNKQEELCTDCGKEDNTAWTTLRNPENPNKTRNVCLDCSIKYKSLFVHSRNPKTGQLFEGALVQNSNILKTEADNEVHICADLKEKNGEYIWELT